MPENRTKITKTVVDTLKPGEKERIVWDSQLTGFGVRVLPSGRKTYVIQYRNQNRRERKMSLGKHGVVTTEEARRKARQLLASISIGDDPAAERKSQAKAETVNDLWDVYYQEHALKRKKPSSAEGDEWLFENHIQKALGKRKVVEVTKQDVLKLHSSLSSTPYLANRVLSLLSKMFSLAEEWGYRPERSNPCYMVRKYKEEGRKRYLTLAELERLGNVLNILEQGKDLNDKGEIVEREKPKKPFYLPGIDAIRFLLFTGLRKSEALNLKWEDVELQKKEIRLRDSKTGGRTVVISTAAVSLLERIQARPVININPYVFPGIKPGKPLVGIQKIWERILKRAEIEDVRIHDLRHTYAAYGAGGGLGLPIVGALLGHTQASTTQRYAHVADDPQRQGTELIGSAISEAMGDK
jgi:integrase